MEAVPVAVTAFVPLAIFPMLGVVDIQEAANPYANKIVFLFLGGFLLATAIQKWDLHKRIALLVLNNAGSKGSSLILGFMITAAVISMWVMNTATTIMLLPIGLAYNCGERNRERYKHSGAQFLSISSSARYCLRSNYRRYVHLNWNWTKWHAGCIYGIIMIWILVLLIDESRRPLSCVMLPGCWFILTKVIF